MNILETHHLTKAFGGLTAVDDVSFGVRRDSISGLIGPNGAGKTTVFNLLTGVYPPSSGTITFTPDDQPISLGAVSYTHLTLPTTYPV